MTVEELARGVYRYVAKAGCKLKEASVEDCGESVTVLFEFDGPCSRLLVDKEGIEEFLKGSKFTLSAVETDKDKVKVVVKEKKACKIGGVKINEEEFELPQVKDEEQLRKLLEKYDKVVVVVGKKNCDVYEKVFPTMLSSALKIAIDPVPVFVVELEDMNDRRFKGFLDEYKVVMCPTVIRFNNGKEVERVEGVEGDSEEEIKKTIKKLRNLLEE